MNQVVEYLSARYDVERVIAIVGPKFSFGILEDLYNGTAVKDIAVLADFEACTKDWKESLVQIIEGLGKQEKAVSTSFTLLDLYAEAERLQIDSHTAILYDGVAERECAVVLRLAKQRPLLLCGASEYGTISNFDLWETCRRDVDSFYLLSWGGRHAEVLEWTRNPKSDVELSVIFPMYNIAKYLQECIDSVTAWKADYVEFLFVDDGSPDNCADIVQQSAEKDARIKLLKKQNGGCASARQYGLDRAKGRYVGFIDPDDHIDESMFRKLFRRAMLGSYDISYCGYKEQYDELNATRNVDDVLGLPFTEGTSNKSDLMTLATYLRIAIWRGIYRRSMLDRNNIRFHTEIRRFDDLPFKMEVYSVARSAVCVPENLYYYRMGRPGQDVSANDERLYVHFPIFAHLDAFGDNLGAKEYIEALQVVKLMTHIFAIKKLLPQYLRKYVKLARRDLLRNMGFLNSVILFKYSVGKQAFAFFFGIYFGSPLLLRYLCRRFDRKEAGAQARCEKEILKLQQLSSL